MSAAVRHVDTSRAAARLLAYFGGPAVLVRAAGQGEHGATWLAAEDDGGLTGSGGDVTGVLAVADDVRPATGDALRLRGEVHFIVEAEPADGAPGGGTALWDVRAARTIGA